MIDSIAKLLGSGFVIPTLALLVVAWASKFLFDMHVSSRQSRKDFLDVWRGIDLNDAVLVETTVRHLWGAYLPADVIRILHRQPFPSRSLRCLATIWEHVDYDPVVPKLYLKRKWKERAAHRRAAFWGYTVIYFLAGSVSLYLTREVVLKQPTDPAAWMLAALTLAAGILAFVCLGRADGLKSLDASSLATVAMLNRELAASAASGRALNPSGVSSDMGVEVSPADACTSETRRRWELNRSSGPSVDAVQRSRPCVIPTGDDDAST